MKKHFRVLTVCLAALLLIQLAGCKTPSETTAPETTAAIEDTTQAPETTAADSHITRDPDEVPVLNPNAKDRGPIKFLSIGMSFNVNETHYLYEMLQEAGYEKVEVAVLYHSGCTLNQHYDFMRKDAKEYRLYYNGKGTWTITDDFTMDMALRMTEWDYISFNPGVESAGLPGVFEPYLTEVINHVRSFQPNAHFLWNMTWAWQENEDNEHRGTFLQLFEGSQMKMFEAIINATKIAMKNHPDLEFVIPLGTAVQNFRTSKFGDEGPWILRDDIGHLSYDLGYYLGALMAAKCISDLDVSALEFIPPDYAKSFEDPALVEGLKAAVQGAFDNPWQVTENPYK